MVVYCTRFICPVFTGLFRMAGYRLWESGEEHGGYVPFVNPSLYFTPIICINIAAETLSPVPTLSCLGGEGEREKEAERGEKRDYLATGCTAMWPSWQIAKRGGEHQ